MNHPKSGRVKKLDVTWEVLVSMEDLRPASLNGIRERFGAEVDLHCYGHSPSNDVPAEPIDDGNKVDETLLHPNIDHINRPHLIRTLHDHP